ncbi:ReoY family proteolytic degradation factor [Oceanobacillus damuensis]|uniref:ReoY family proteolytic degradation factor n=1 Tax=Oceanobacillus damuensis TaxID=937928 RepID=UPI00083553F6|nr:ReoY family proteolytic degradation factor [Oceanobacillus damuensis]
MISPVTAKDKKSFIQWFLNHYRLKKRESVWILNYLVNHNELLANVHFVRDVKYCPRGIMMTSHCSEEVPFRFYKNHLVTTDAEKSFHEIRLNQNEPLYLQLNFKKSNQHSYYASVLEENPFIPVDYYITNHDKDLANQILSHSLYEYKKNSLLTEIDRALDDMNLEEFQRLTDRLNELKSSNFNQPDHK